MKRVIAGLLAAALMAFSLVGCSGGSTSSSSAAGTGDKAESSSAEAKKTAAMIVQIPAGDPFIELAYAGVKQLGEKYNMDTKIIEALDKSEHVEQIRSMAKIGANPIYVLWDELGEAVLEVAPLYPDTKFIIGDAYVKSDLPNVATIVVEPYESAFIAGYVAAKTTQTKKIAFAGSMDNPVINRFKSGYINGAKYANPSVGVEVVYVGSANDPVKGQEVAKILVKNGADVIMQAANKSGLGIIKGCEEMGVKAIGVDDWQGAINEDVVIWSALKDITGAIFYAGDSVVNDKFESGMREYNLTDGISMYDDRDFAKLSPELQKEVEAVVAGIKDGSINVMAE
ncbi:MAG: BMP family ABC transporter substrate-binding protein [Angelakisella sp.]